MRRLISTLAIDLAPRLPLLHVSEDRWPGRILLAAVIAIELSIVGITVLLNQWNARFYNALQDRNWDAFVNQLGLFLRAGGDLHRARGLSALPEPVAADPLAALDDDRSTSSTGSSGANHYRMQLLGDAADNPDQRISEDIALFIDRRSRIGAAAAQLDRHAGLVRGDPVDAVGGGAAASVRRDL